MRTLVALARSLLAAVALAAASCASSGSAAPADAATDVEAAVPTTLVAGTTWTILLPQTYGVSRREPPPHERVEATDHAGVLALAVDVQPWAGTLQDYAAAQPSPEYGVNTRDVLGESGLEVVRYSGTTPTAWRFVALARGSLYVLEVYSQPTAAERETVLASWHLL